MVRSGSTVSVNVVTVSHPPVVLATVSVSDPAALNKWPYHVYGSWLAHTAIVCVVVRSGSTVSVNVVTVSHPPVVLATVSVSDPAALNKWPYHVYGSWLAHTAIVCVVVRSGSTVSVNVLAVSHPPVVLATVSFIVPAALNTWPYHVYGSWLAQTAIVCVVVRSGSTVSVNVLAVSHPPVVLATVSFIVPAALNTWPYHVYGSWLAQTAIVCVVVRSGSTVSVNVLAVSHPPVVLATVSFIVPAALNTWPYHVYGSWLAQTAIVCVVVRSGSTVSVNVLAVSHPPVVLATVSFIVPAALNTWPYHVYGSWLAHTAIVCVVVRSGSTVSVNVLAVSHPPVVLATVSFIVAAALNTWPYHVYGSWLAHTPIICVVVRSGSTVSVNVLAVSHPPVVLATVSFIVPAALNTWPYHVYGSWLAQ